MKKILYSLLSIMLLCSAYNCKTTQKETTDKSQETGAVLVEKQNVPKKESMDASFEKGKIHVKLKPLSKEGLPVFEKGKPRLGDYPVLQPIIDQFNIQKIYRTHPNMNTANMSNVYTIEFDENENVDQLIATLKRMDAIEYAEKVPLNSKK